MGHSRATCSRIDASGGASRVLDCARIKRRVAEAALFVVVCLPLLIPAVAPPVARAQESMQRDTIVINTRTGSRQISAEIAMTMTEKGLGLMYRTEMGDTEGMLFPYSPPQEVHMWMHNTYVPLDMLFIDATGKVLRIETEAEPLSDRVIASKGLVTGVLELKGGAAGKLGIAAGDTVVSARLPSK